MLAVWILSYIGAFLLGAIISPALVYFYIVHDNKKNGRARLDAAAKESEEFDIIRPTHGPILT